MNARTLRMLLTQSKYTGTLASLVHIWKAMGRSAIRCGLLEANQCDQNM